MIRFCLFGSLLAVVLMAVPVIAADDPTHAGEETYEHEAVSGGNWFFPGGKAGIALGTGLGAGLVVMGAARGIGNIGSSAVESIARQPEAGGRVFTSMLLAAALIEGFTFFALLIPFGMTG